MITQEHYEKLWKALRGVLLTIGVGILVFALVKGHAHVCDIDVGAAGQEAAREGGNLPDHDRDQQNSDARDRCEAGEERSGDRERANEWYGDHMS